MKCEMPIIRMEDLPASSSAYSMSEPEKEKMVYGVYPEAQIDPVIEFEIQYGDEDVALFDSMAEAVETLCRKLKKKVAPFYIGKSVMDPDYSVEWDMEWTESTLEPSEVDLHAFVKQRVPRRVLESIFRDAKGWNSRFKKLSAEMRSM
jgi:hypothetical protein